MKHYYALYNHYGNNVIGLEQLHVFDSEADRDIWVQDDPNNRRNYARSSHRLARKYRQPISDTHGLHYEHHHGDGTVFVCERENGREHAEQLQLYYYC